MDVAELGRAVDSNIASIWASLGRSMGGEVADVGTMTLVATGLPLAFFNGAFLRATTDQPDHLVAAATEFFGERKVPWLLWVRDGVSPATLEAGRSAGLRDVGGPPAMGLLPIPPAPPLPAGLTIEIATSEATLRDHASMLRDGFGMPQEVVDRMIRPALLEEPNLAALVGRIDGEPVSCSLLGVTGRTAGVYNVATPARLRGKGYGEALTWAAVAEGARRSCSHAVLQASDSGYPIYRRMGFADLGRYVQLEGPPAAEVAE